MIEKITQWNLVKFIGSLINPENLSKRISKIVDLYESNSLGTAAKRLFIWCLVIIIISTIIDQVFYWLRPEQKIRLARFIEHAKVYTAIISEKIKVLTKKRR